MANVGGDLATLADLRNTFKTSQDDVQQLVSKIDGSLSSTVWEGTNARKFADAWAQFKPTLTNQLVNTLVDAENDIKQQHNQLAAATGENVSI